MAVYTTIDDAGSYFAKVLTLTGTGSTRAVTYGGTNAIQPDLVWAKCRSNGYNNNLCDAVRGVTKILKSGTSAAETTDTQSLTAFGADGFTMGTNTPWNGSGPTYVYWSWKAGTTTGITTDGSTTITPGAYSFNQTAGISIIEYTGNAVSGAKLAHGLGTTPAMVIVKNLQTTASWMIYHQYSNAVPEDYGLQLDTVAAAGDNADLWNDTAPDSVNVTLGSADANGSGNSLIGYCFADVQGYSKFGGYTGNGNADGTFVYTGFAVAYLLIKRVDSTGDWYMFDNKRNTYNPRDKNLRANKDEVESSGSSYYIDFLSNGFRVLNTNTEMNAAGGDYIYMAFAASPLVNSSGVPTNAVGSTS